MGQKTISLPSELYFQLKDKKKQGETFPDLINRLIDKDTERIKSHSIMDLAGTFGEESDEWEKIEKGTLYPNN
ncbi:MAG: antitoxin VapB family protein [Promethearchaeota archaeon]